MTGDGCQDLVLVQGASVTYWPNRTRVCPAFTADQALDDQTLGSVTVGDGQGGGAVGPVQVHRGQRIGDRVLLAEGDGVGHRWC